MKNAQPNNPNRQNLTRPLGDYHGLLKSTPIIPREQLEGYLQKALLVEHFTIPPYLCALYSIQEGSNLEAAAIIRSVVVEEMLHMVLVANIMNALGYKPKIVNVVPVYPGPLPNLDTAFTVNLLKFSKEAINTFLRIERPANPSSQASGFSSIGVFYEAIRASLHHHNENTKGGIFLKDSLQVGKEHYYGAGGNIIKVTDIESADEAIQEIVGQGEGIDGSINDPDDKLHLDDIEYAHYFRFNEIFHERYYGIDDKPHDAPSGEKLNVDWNAVYNIEPNPTIEKFKDKWLKDKVKACNKTYRDLLQNLDDAVNKDPKKLFEGIPIMHHLRNQAIELMKIPSGNGNYTAGPTFEI